MEKRPLTMRDALAECFYLWSYIRDTNPEHRHPYEIKRGWPGWKRFDETYDVDPTSREDTLCPACIYASTYKRRCCIVPALRSSGLCFAENSPFLKWAKTLDPQYADQIASSALEELQRLGRPKRLSMKRALSETVVFLKAMKECLRSDLPARERLTFWTGVLFPDIDRRYGIPFSSITKPYPYCYFYECAKCPDDLQCDSETVNRWKTLAVNKKFKEAVLALDETITLIRGRIR